MWTPSVPARLRRSRGHQVLGNIDRPRLEEGEPRCRARDLAVENPRHPLLPAEVVRVRHVLDLLSRGERHRVVGAERCGVGSEPLPGPGIAFADVPLDLGRIQEYGTGHRRRLHGHQQGIGHVEGDLEHIPAHRTVGFLAPDRGDAEGKQPLRIQAEDPVPGPDDVLGRQLVAEVALHPFPELDRVLPAVARNVPGLRKQGLRRGGQVSHSIPVVVRRDLELGKAIVGRAVDLAVLRRRGIFRIERRRGRRRPDDERIARSLGMGNVLEQSRHGDRDSEGGKSAEESPAADPPLHEVPDERFVSLLARLHLGLP